MPAPTTRLILIRHGETAWNRAKRIQGHIDIPLSEHGHAQAAALAQRWNTKAHDSAALREFASGPASGSANGSASAPNASPYLAPLSAIISSDLSRAAQTAAPLVPMLDERSPYRTVQLTEGLRERRFGVFESTSKAEIAARWPEVYAQWMADDPDFAPEGGESLREFYTRVWTTLAGIVRRYGAGSNEVRASGSAAESASAGDSPPPITTIACVAHGGVLDCAFRFAKRSPLAAPRTQPLLNASINVLTWTVGNAPEDDQVNVDVWADVAHLASLDPAGSIKNVGDDAL